MTSIPEWTEGVCGDGAAILRDGEMVPIEDVIATLNLHEGMKRLHDARLHAVLQDLQVSAVQVRDEMLISRSDWADILAKAFGYGLRHD